MNSRFALRNYAGTPTAYYLVEQVDLPADNNSVVKQASHHVLVIDRSGSMYGDIDSLKPMVEKVLTLEEYSNADLYVSLVSYSSSGDVTVHFDHVKVSDVMKPGSRYIEDVRGIRATASTCISQGLDEARKLVRKGELTCISLHTDGYANDPSPRAEVQTLEKLIGEIQKLDNAFVNTIAYNSWSDFKLLSKIANECSGVCIQAVNVKQVFDALHKTAALLAGKVTPATTITTDGASYLAFVSKKAGRVNGSTVDLVVRGLKPDDDRVAYRYRKVTEAVYNASTLPVCGDKASLEPVYAYARAMISEGNLNAAKYAVVATRNADLLNTHYRALTNAEIATFAADLDDTLLGMPRKGMFQTHFGLDVSSASVLELCGVLGENASAISVNLQALGDIYVKRGIKRVPGTRNDDGTVTMPPVKTRYKGTGDWAQVSSFDINKNTATINMLVTRDVELVKVEDDTVISSVAGIKLNDLKTFNNYTIVGDGSLNVAELKVRVNNKKAFKALVDIGAVSGDFDPKAEYTISFSGRPTVSFNQKFDTLDGLPRKLMRAQVLTSIIAATLKEQSDLYTAEQLDELKKHCLSGSLYINIPTMTEYANLKDAIATGLVDTRISYKIEIGDKDILNGGKLHSANKFLDRMFTVQVDGQAVEKVSFAEYWKPTFTALYKVLSGRTKITEIDNFMKPIFEDFLGLNKNGAVYAILDEAGADDALKAAMMSAIERKTTVDQGVDTFTAAKRLLNNYTDNLLRTQVCPVVFYIGSTGLLPDEYETKALTAEQLEEKYPEVSLAKAERDGLFYEVGSTIISVYTKSEHFSTGREALRAAA
jgi:hypothetical protein